VKASSPYRCLYGYRSEGSVRTHTYAPDSHASSHSSSHPPAHRRASTSHQLTTDAYLRGGESNLYCFVPWPILVTTRTYIGRWGNLYCFVPWPILVATRTYIGRWSNLYCFVSWPVLLRISTI